MFFLLVTKIFFTLFFLVILITVSVFVYFKFFLYNYWEKRYVPSKSVPIPLGFLTNVLWEKKHVADVIATHYNEFSDHRFFGAYALHRHFLVIRDPDLIKCVLTKNFPDFHDRGLYFNEKVDPLAAHLFFLPGEKWQKLRGKLSPTFTAGKMKQMFSIIKNCGDIYAEAVEIFAKRSMTIDIAEITNRFTTNVIATAIFGLESDCINESKNEIRKWTQLISSSKPIRRSLAGFAPSILENLKINLVMKESYDFLLQIFKDSIDYRNKNNITKGDFLDMLRELMQNSNNDEPKKENATSELVKLSFMEAAAQAFVFFLAGFETSSGTIVHCLYELSMNQEIQEKTRTDINENLEKNNGILTYDILQQMNYLNKVVCETMRKYPSLGILNRVCNNDFEIPASNIKIEKGTPIIIPVLGLHRDPKYYPDPEKFDPERFESENIGKRHSSVYLPFGDGPRICIGMRFGLMQTKIGLISLLSRYRFYPCSETKIPLVHCHGKMIYFPTGSVDLKVELCG